MVAISPGTSNEAGDDTRQPDSIGEALERVHSALERAELCFGHGTDNAWDEAVVLVLSAAGLALDSSESVLIEAMTDAAWGKALGWLKSRIDQRIPLPYLTGEAWFAGLPFRCDARALVPRSPMAELIRNDYRPWWQGAEPEKLLDLCCGGGSIGIAAAMYGDNLSVTLADIDTAALALAAENIALHQQQSRVSARQSDLFNALDGERFDIILCNPPYVDADDLATMPEEYLAEPARGLGAGMDGLAFARRVLLQAEQHLTEHGLLFMELGNSWAALDQLLHGASITWLEFTDGGHGVCVLRREELPELRSRLA